MEDSCTLTTCFVFLVSGVVHNMVDGRNTRSSLLDTERKQVRIPISKSFVNTIVFINGTGVSVQDSRLPSILMSLYQNISREIAAEPDPKLRSAFQESLDIRLLDHIEKLIVPGLDSQQRAKIKNLRFKPEGYYVAERAVLVAIILVVVGISVVVFIYWFVNTVLDAAVRRGNSQIGLTELDDLDVYSTEMDDESICSRRQKSRSGSRRSAVYSKKYRAVSLR